MKKLKLNLTELSVETFSTKENKEERGTVAGNTGPLCAVTGYFDCPTEYQTCVNCDTGGGTGGGGSTAVSDNPPCC